MKQRYILLLLIGVFSRILPHPANVTAMTSLSFLSGREIPRPFAVVLIILTLFISDSFLAYINHCPLLGSWSVFTYSGFILITLLSKYTQQTNTGYIPIFIIGMSCGYWLWTNLGTWFFTTLYPNTLSGLIDCYISALPFLRNGIIGDLLWMLILLAAMHLPKISYQLDEA